MPRAPLAHDLAVGLTAVNRRLRPDDVLRFDPSRVSWTPLPARSGSGPAGVLFVHPAGRTFLAGAEAPEIRALLAAVDGERTAEEVVEAAAPALSTRRASTLLRRLAEEVLEVEDRALVPAPAAASPAALPDSTGLEAAIEVVGDGEVAEALCARLAEGQRRGGGEALRRRVIAPARAALGDLLRLQREALRDGVPSFVVRGEADGARIGPTAVPLAPSPEGSGASVSPCLGCALLSSLPGPPPASREEAGALLAALGRLPSRLPSGPAAIALAESVLAELARFEGGADEPRTLTGLLYLPAGRERSGGERTVRVERRPECPVCSPDEGSGTETEGNEPSSDALRADLLAAEGWLREPLRAVPARDRRPVRTVGILGGGTAGYLTALALRAKVPELAVTLIESPHVPILGVGEATTPLMPQFLHADLGLPVGPLFAEVRPTFKLGIRFLWGEPDGGDFPYPFGPAQLLESLAYDPAGRRFESASLAARLMAADRAPVFAGGPVGGEETGALLPRFSTDVAYHLDNAPFAAYLARRAAEAGVERVAATVREVERSADGSEVAALVTQEAGRLTFDLYVDASGFRALLLGQALGSPWMSFAPSLPADRALAAPAVPVGGSAGPPLRPYTTAETLSAGWCWNVPQLGGDHRGYVFASAFQGDDEATAEMRRAVEAAGTHRMGEPRVITFRCGRHEHFWSGNVVAMGNAYGFVEPLESTALHMLIRQIGLLTGSFPLARGEQGALAGMLSRRVAGWWDYLRFFLTLHYRFNRWVPSAFWRMCREELELGEHAWILDLYRQRGPLSYDPGARRRLDSPDPLWGPEGIDTLLLGQGVFPGQMPVPAVPEALWRQRQAQASRAASRALSHRRVVEQMCASPAPEGAEDAARRALQAQLETVFRRNGPAFPSAPTSASGSASGDPSDGASGGGFGP